MLAPAATLEKVAERIRVVRGAVRVSKDQRVPWSEIPNNQIMQFHPGSNIAGTYRTHVGLTNGRTIDAHVW